MKKTLQLLLIVFTITVQGQNKIFSAVSEYYDLATTSWQNYSGGNYEYDSNDNVISVISFVWTDGVWKNYYKTSYTYNASNKVTEEVDQLWNATTNTFENDNKSSYTYTSGKVTEIIYSEWTSPNWILIDKSVISYGSNNLPNGALSYLWNGTQWVIDGRDTTTYNANQKLTEYLGEKWINSTWVNDFKSLYTYNSNNKLVTVRYAGWDEFNNNWEENERNDYELDATGNRTKRTISAEGDTSKLEYNYDTSSLMASFANPFKDKTGLEYFIEDFPHINKVLGYNEFRYDVLTSSYDLIGRHAYNYNSSITLGTELQEIADNKIIVYPNPTTDFLTIQNSSNTEIDAIKVSDISGKTVLQQNQNNTQIDVQNLVKGMYLLQVLSGNKEWKTKFLKE